MTDGKERRQRAIAELIRGGALANQEELAERLATLGYAVTQATISRDLEQIGAVKVRRDGQLSYALPEQMHADPGRQLAGVLRDFVRTIDTASNLVVLKSPPGSAHMIGVVLDQSDLPQIVGTICGDDTIFIACPSPKMAAELATGLREASAKLQ